ncbi:nucleotide exchange factor GrpE [Atopobacter sp. AH10]|uniref:nucleotide exchange factor GrpE n=1 Tax=Atopobacter sp. AH10 TaxID=2315861 RepID=UPI000EF25340|nr:nucleotide exchange factor GrpE [Atopobacter sp. AH10]RLK63405.1 nucleotide exchange factor GrpE [Atopobacter sp. AH10]
MEADKTKKSPQSQEETEEKLEETISPEITSKLEEEVNETSDNEEASPNIQALETSIKEKDAKISELEDKILRISAELANIQKRNARERQEAAKYRSQALAQALLPAIDNLERALALSVESEEAKKVLEGVTMVKQAIDQALKAEDITIIDPVDQPFDPNFHHAVQAVPVEEGKEADTVATVLQKGYVLKERVIRPAMVIVRQ